MGVGKGHSLGAFVGHAVRGDHGIPAALAQAGQQGVKTQGLPFQLQAHLLDHQLGHFHFKTRQLGALEEVERGKLAFGGDDDLAVLLDLVQRAGLGGEGGAQRDGGDNGSFEKLHSD
ncbi:hypothetical protein D3C87_1920460 [compost metagenome]